MRMENESQLIQRAAVGDASAFNELLGAHEKQMYVVCYRMCGNYNDAQDCLQEAMLRVFRALPGFKSQSSFSTWLYRITMNACLDELRRRKTRPNASLDGLLEVGWSPKSESEAPDDQVIRSERAKALHAAIAELPEEMRSAIVLRDIRGFAYEEIADMLNVNIGTIKSRISRGREKLREKIMTNAELFDKHGV